MDSAKSYYGDSVIGLCLVVFLATFGSTRFDWIDSIWIKRATAVI